MHIEIHQRLHGKQYSMDYAIAATNVYNSINDTCTEMRYWLD